MSNDEVNDSGDGYSSDVAALAADFQSEVEAPVLDRRAAIRSLDALGRLVMWKSLELDDDDFAGLGPMMELYGDMEIYNLLEQGWGRDLYSTGEEPDPLDVALFVSLVAVLQATERAMRGADLNKRAYEAFGWHALHPTGRALIDSWIGRLTSYVGLADAQESSG